MEPAFNIQSPNIDTTSADLYIEISGQGLSYIILENSTCVALVIYNFDAGISDEAVADHIHQVITDQPLLQQKFNKTYIIYGYAQSVLVPDEFLNSTASSAMLELVYGDTRERIIKIDFIQRLAIHNIYGVPSVIDMVITRYFNFASYLHLFSVLPDMVRDEENHLFCIFGTGQLKLILLKNSRLQVMQTYSYKLPEDVGYYLLNLCRGFGINANEIKIRLSGMIDENSALYNELYKYFLQVVFDELPNQFNYPEELRQYPAHYFSHLFEIAACV